MSNSKNIIKYWFDMVSLSWFILTIPFRDVRLGLKHFGPHLFAMTELIVRKTSRMTRKWSNPEHNSEVLKTTGMYLIHGEIFSATPDSKSLRSCFLTWAASRFKNSFLYLYVYYGMAGWWLCEQFLVMSTYSNSFITVIKSCLMIVQKEESQCVHCTPLWFIRESVEILLLITLPTCTVPLGIRSSLLLTRLVV